MTTYSVQSTEYALLISPQLLCSATNTLVSLLVAQIDERHVEICLPQSSLISGAITTDPTTRGRLPPTPPTQLSSERLLAPRYSVLSTPYGVLWSFSMLFSRYLPYSVPSSYYYSVLPAKHHKRGGISNLLTPPVHRPQSGPATTTASTVTVPPALSLH